ncbi:MAG: carboxypeptidase regulatory-like domain-containing protein [Porticoccaceae bacterium]|nr:carboxypeptidase regulatory-like domain-containing protein [Porticoccaceae bacterium]
MKKLPNFNIFYPLALLVILAGIGCSESEIAPSKIALTGSVFSEKEGAMEGVVVIVQDLGDTVLTAVTSDAAGQFQFHRDRLKAGKYEISIRAAGYEMLQPRTVVVDKITLQNLGQLSLVAVTEPLRLASQLTSLDWVQSFPGSQEQKDLLVKNMVNCGFCHSLERIARSSYTAEGLVQVIQRMHTYETDHASADRIQVVSKPKPIEGLIWYGRKAADIAEYLATVNLSGGKSQWDYPLQTLPRPSGEGTNATVTVFPIPRQPSVIHDLDVDSKGNVWYGNTGWDFIGKLNPRTGAFSEWPSPNFLPEPEEGLMRIVGVQDIQVDETDTVWVAVMGNKHASFSPETETWQTYDLPVIWKNPFLGPVRAGEDGLWATGITSPPDGPVRHEHAFRFDIKTGELGKGIMLFDDKPFPTDPNRVGQLNYCYMMDQDADGNFLCTAPEASSIARSDSEGNVRLVSTPTPNAYPRRGYRDDNNHFWFTEFFADNVASIDLATDKITEYPIQPRYISPYYARPDRSGKIWISSTGSDRLMRLDPETGEVVKYLMPVSYDARKVVVDNSADRITVWLPNKNHGQLIRIEVAD